MAKLRLGQIDYINYIPIYHALEEGQLPLDVDLIKGSPSELSKLFSAGELEITPISAIEYIQYASQAYILPNISISSDGEIGSVFLFSRVPVTELEGKKVALSNHSPTPVALLKVLLEHYFHVEVEYVYMEADLDDMLANADAALLIDDKAIQTNQRVISEGLALTVTDLGLAWKEFTGEKMVFVVWVIRKDFADRHPSIVNNVVESLHRSKLLGMKQTSTLVEKVNKNIMLPKEVLENYFHTILLEFDDDYRRALNTFYDYAYKSGLIEERIKLSIWGESNE